MGEGSVSTSGDGEQFVADRGRRIGHIFDPRTRTPADALLSATVIARSATLADALSTAAVVLGPERAGALLQSLGAGGIFARRRTDDGLRVTVTPGAVFTPDLN
jgi:thiamine biosynthesis lipoprotein